MSTPGALERSPVGGLEVGLVADPGATELPDSRSRSPGIDELPAGDGDFDRRQEQFRVPPCPKAALVGLRTIRLPIPNPIPAAARRLIGLHPRHRDLLEGPDGRSWHRHRFGLTKMVPRCWAAAHSSAGG